jgi:ABC-type nitrate/sulfonate/bicarbonate transport system substrate-binding protein
MRFNRRDILGSAVGLAFWRPTLAAAATKLRVQTGWIPNVQYAGEWLADSKGYFAKAGLDVQFIPGGPNAVPVPVILAAGNIELGYTNWFQFLDAVMKGNDFVMVAADLPKNPLGIISLAKKPILKPQDIVGSRMLVQGPNEETAINATLALAGLPKQWKEIRAGFSPEPLLAGDGDGYTAFAVNQTITLEQMGMKKDKDFFFVSFDDLGFRSYGAILATTRAFLTANRSAVVAYVGALIKGWQENEKDPTVAAHLAVEKYGADFGLDLKQQIRQNELQIPYTKYDEPGHLPLSLDRKAMVGPMYAAARATGRENLPAVDKIADFTIVEDAVKAQ